MEPMLDSEVERILVVTAHPDDLDFGAGGTIAQWAAKGIAISYCICTNGDQGGIDATITREEMKQIRRREQTDAGAILGVTDIHFLDYRDGWLAPTIELRKDIVRVIRKVRPQRMLIQSPERNWNRLGASHPDHLAAGEAAIQAIYPDSGNRFAFEDLLEIEHLEPWNIKEAWVMMAEGNDHHVDITDTFDLKMKALAAHVSQTSHMEGFEERIREWGTRSGEAVGLTNGRMAETFKIVSLG
jgi:LmbE family N-acetylglucosaminyl deacetylase